MLIDNVRNLLWLTSSYFNWNPRYLFYVVMLTKWLLFSFELHIYVAYLNAFFVEVGWKLPELSCGKKNRFVSLLSIVVVEDVSVCGQFKHPNISYESEKYPPFSLFPTTLVEKIRIPGILDSVKILETKIGGWEMSQIQISCKNRKI